MADYYSLIARAVSALSQPTPEARQAVYERARKALFNQLRGIQPPVAESDIAAEGRALEEAITRVEIELSAKAAPAPRQEAPPHKDAAPPRKDAPPPRPADAPARPQEPPRPREPHPQPDEWTAPLGETESAPREPQRPAAPLPPAAPPATARRRILAVSAVLIALIAVVGVLGWQLRERPEDLARLKPEESASADGEGGKIGDRVEGDADPVAQTGKRALPVAQKGELWVASVQDPSKVDKIYNATVVWRLDNVGGGGEPVASAIRGDVEIPDAKAKATLQFRKNTDATLSASHTINISFSFAPDSPLGGVKAIGPIQMRRADAQSGEKVIGIPVPITENNFLIGLMRGDREARNIGLMRSLNVLDLPLQLNDGRVATLNMEKGPSGERVFSDAIDSWSR